MTVPSWRIHKIQVLPLQAPLIQPFRTALGSHDTLDNLLCVLTLADGTKGYGEAAIATHITGETLEATRRNLHAAGEEIEGKDSRDYLKISGGLHERWGKNPAMIAAVEIALWDALTRRLGIPLWRWFGCRCRRLRTDITIVIADLAETEETVRCFYQRGFRHFKVKIGCAFDLDVNRVMAVHRLAPEGVIYLDANQGFSAAQTLQFLRVLQRREIRPSLLEQPVAAADREGLKKVARSTEVPVCADESARSVAEALDIIREKAADVLNIKLMKFGAVQALEIIRLARAAGTGLMIGGMMESALAMTAAAHLAAGTGAFSYIDLDTPFFIRGKTARPPCLSDRGVYDLRRIQKGIGVIPKT